MEIVANENAGWGKRLWESVSLRMVLLVLLTLAVYAPVQRAGFIWDDDDHVTANPAIAAPDGLHRIWSSLAVARYYPLTLTSFWVEHRLWGFQPAPYHAVNVILHALNAVLLYELLRRLQIKGAWFAALVWALHPVCVESVAWVTELKNVQSGFFFFLALLAYLHFEENPKPLRYCWLLICAAAAMLSKSSTVILPVVILLMVWWRRGGLRREDWLRSAPLFAAGLGMALWTVREQHYQIGRSTIHEVTLNFLQRILLAARAVWFYLGKVFWPDNLTFLYPHWTIDPKTLLAWAPILALVFAVALIFSLRNPAWRRACWFGLGFFVMALLPILGFSDLFFFRYSYVADHFQYLACIGPIVLISAAGMEFVRWRWVRGIIAGILLLVLSGNTWQYTHVFENLVMLWRDVIDKKPDAWLAHNNLGVLLAANNDFPNADAEYQAAIRLKPDFAEAHSNRGNLFVRQHRWTAAAAEYALAVESDPQFAGAYYNLGNAYAVQYLWAQAIQSYQAALRVRPDFPEARHNLESALKRQQQAEH